MAKKSTSTKAKNNFVLDLEIVIVILSGAVVLIGFGMYQIYIQREMYANQTYNLQQLSTQQEKQLSDLKEKMSVSVTPDSTNMK